MTRADLLAQLRKLDPADTAGVRKLAQTIGNDGGAAAEAVVHAWATGDSDTAFKGALVAQELGVFAIDPLLVEATKTKVPLKLDLLTAAVVAAVRLRNQVLRHLDALLLDDGPLDPPLAQPPAGLTAKPQRLCDQAYFAIRSIVRVAPDARPQPPELAAFLASTPGARDAEIKRWTQTLAWEALRDAFEDLGSGAG
jgi:hypothetical protein